MRGAFRIAFDHWTPTAGPLIRQLQRSALSVQLNIAEGYGLKSGASFRRHLRIAYGSAIETSDLVGLLREFGVAPTGVLDRLEADNGESKWLRLGLLRKLR